MTTHARYDELRPHPRIAFVVYNSMHHDTRVVREAQAAIAAGATVRVFAFGGESVSYYPVGPADIDGVEVDRVPITTIRRGLIVAGQVVRRLLGRPVPATPGPTPVTPPAVPATPAVGSAPTVTAPQRGAKQWVIKQWQRADLTVRQFSFWRSATRAIEAWQPDLVHAHDANTLVVAGRVARKLKVPFVYDSHELWTQRNVSPDRPVAKRLEGPMERWWARRAVGIITVSPSIAQWLRTHYGLRETPALVRNIPPLLGETPDPEHGRLRELAGLSVDTSVVAYCGGITTNRGIERGIEALPHLAPTVHLVLLGRGSEVYIAGLLRLADSLGVRDRVHLVGAVDSDQVSATLADADVSLVLTQPAVLSYAFSLPNKLFESLHAGVPVVVSDTPDASALVAEYGIGVVVPVEGSAAELAQTIETVIAGGESYRAAGHRAAHELNWQTEEATLIQVHTHALSGSGKERRGANPVRRAAWKALAAMPESVQMRANPGKYGFTAKDVPPPVAPPATDVRLYIGPVNSASQGYRWARAAELLPGVGAVSMQHRTARDFGFPADYALPTTVFVRSQSWQKAQFEAVSKGFTHVIVESQRPLFADLFAADVEREVEALRRAGIKVAMLCHGSDIRLPSRHRELDQWSPFRADEWDRTPALEEQAREARRIMAAVGVPVYVSTPDLLLDWPEAQWLPTVVDPHVWRCDIPILEREVPVVLHAPSNPIVKGSALIEPVMERLATEGLVDYRRVQGVQSSEMPALYAGADIVLEQFRIGNYSVAAEEAMAAGRLVIGHVHDQVRDHVRVTYGRDVPVVEATPDTLEAVLRDVLADRDRYREIAAYGVEFATAVHDGRESAAVLKNFLRSGPEENDE